MIADEHLLATFNKHYNIPSLVSQVEAQGIQIMVSMGKNWLFWPICPICPICPWCLFGIITHYLFYFCSLQWLEINCGWAISSTSPILGNEKALVLETSQQRKLRMTVCQIKDISLPAPRRKPLKFQICEKLQNHRLKHSYLVKKLMIWFVIVIMTLINIQTPVQNWNQSEFYFKIKTFNFGYKIYIT